MKILSKRTVIIVALVGIIFLILFFGLSYFFPVGSPSNIPISVFTKDQGDPQIGEDGLGGAVVAWNDTRNGDKDIYAQRLEANGSLKWKKNGIPISKGFGEQRDPQVTSLGKKETVIAWSDTRNGDLDIYAQKLDSGGKEKWEKNGTPIILIGGDQRDFKFLAQGGDLFVVWVDNRDGKSSIYGQKLNSRGELKWGFKGIRLSISESEQSHPQISALSPGELMVVWEELDSNSIPQIKAQRITQDGQLKWPHQGVLVAGGARAKVDPRVISDERGGAIIVWEDRRSGKEHVYAQKINREGKLLWGESGVLLAQSQKFQWHPEMVSDGQGGAVVIWKDDRSGDDDVYAQRVDENGKILWGKEGFFLSAEKRDQSFIKIARLDENWAGVVWKDDRSEKDDIYAQIVSLSAKKKKTRTGSPISVEKANQQDPQIVGGQGSKVFIVWSDYRNGKERDVYGAVLKF